MPKPEKITVSLSPSQWEDLLDIVSKMLEEAEYDDDLVATAILSDIYTALQESAWK